MCVISFLHVCMTVCANMCAGARVRENTVHVCIWRPEVNLRCYPLGSWFWPMLSQWKLGLTDGPDKVDNKPWIYLLSPLHGWDYSHKEAKIPCLASLHGCWRLNTGPHFVCQARHWLCHLPSPFLFFIYTTLDVPCTLVERGKIILETNTPR